MSFKDYSRTPSLNTALGDGTYIGPNMLRNKVRPALQQLAADGREVADDVASATAYVDAYRQLLSTAAININVSGGLVVRPESYGSVGPGVNAAPAMASAAAAALLLGATVKLSASQTYELWTEVSVPAGVSIEGPRSAVLKLGNQVTTTLTEGVGSGTGATTLVVTSTAGFAVGRSVMLATSPSTTSHNDAFSHANRVITTIGTNSLTLGAGPNIGAHAAGAVVATTSHLLRLLGNNALRGFTVDGNEANNLYGHWVNTSLIAVEGDNCLIDGLLLKNTPTDAILFAGPSGGQIKGCWIVNNAFENIGGNGVHCGNSRDTFVGFNRAVNGNMRYNELIIHGGADSDNNDLGEGDNGHHNGFVGFSDDSFGLVAIGNSVQNWLGGFASFSTRNNTSPVVNDQVTIALNEIIDCYRPLEVSAGTKRIVFHGNRCRATFPFGSGSNRWDSHTIFFFGDHLEDRVQNVICTDNLITNGRILFDRVHGGVMTGNIIDNRDQNGATFSNSINYGIILQNCDGIEVGNNIVHGGFVSIFLVNGFATGAPYGRDTNIHDNLCLNPYARGVAGSFSSTGRLEGTVVRDNLFRADSAATKDDFSTALSFSASWVGIELLEGLQVENNRIEYNVGGASAWSEPHAPTARRRRFNMVNSLYELLPNFADDAAAAAGNVPVGALYRNGSVVMQRAV